MLAGMSVTWYTWLEQGREIRLSGYALDRLVKALKLSPSDAAYLYSLADVPYAGTAAVTDQLNETLRRVLDGYSGGPAFLITPWCDVEAFNRLADYVFDFDGHAGPFSKNHVWRLFMDPSRKKIYADWNRMAELAVFYFRTLKPTYSGMPYFDELVEVLNRESDEFRHLWNAQQTVSVFDTVFMKLQLRDASYMSFSSLRFHFPATEDRVLFLMVPEDAAEVRRLQQLTAGSRRVA